MKGGKYRGCYVAPEIIRGEWNIKNDEFAVGVILHYMAIGDVPCFEDTYQETFKKLLEYKFNP
jgi:hypothetical protein